MKSSVKTDKSALLRSLSIWLLFSFFAFNSALALDPNRRIAQYAHSVWKIQDGFLKGVPFSIAQTTDGYLWIGTMAGLVRFDGVQFASWLPPDGKQLPSPTIASLTAARDGSLWIGTYLGLSHWVNQELINYAPPMGAIYSILEDHNGKIWFTLVDTNDHVGALCEVIDFGTHCFGKADGVQINNGYALSEDKSGNFWIADVDHVLQGRPGSFVAYKAKRVNANAGIDGARTLNLAPGFTWVGMDLPGSGLGLQQLKNGMWKPFVTSGFDSSTLAVTTTFLDREGSLWVGTGGQGLYRISGDNVDRFGSADGLSSDTVFAIYEDHEGNLWVGTTGGIDAFRQVRVTSFPGPKQPGTEEADGVLASRDGAVWVARPESLDALRNNKVSSIQTGKGLPGNQVTSLLEDHAGRLWVGIDDTLSIYTKGKFQRINRADGRPIGVVVGITEDMENTVWAETKGPPRTLFRIQDSKVREEFPVPQLPGARKIAADPRGGIWLGLLSGDLARYRNGKLETFTYPRIGSYPEIKQLTVNSDGTVFGATQNGVVAWKDGKQQTLTVRNGLPCDNVFVQILDSYGSLWLYAECGLIRIPEAELRKWWEYPNVRLQTDLLDRLDGVRPGDPPFNGAARTPDGRLWFVNWIGLQMIDPADTTRNAIPPPVHIEALIADKRSYLPAGNVRLPPLPAISKLTTQA